MHAFSAYLKSRAKMVDTALGRYLPAATVRPPKIHEAMRYSMFGGGKRVRPVLCLAACDAVGGSTAKALPAACALEMIHTYSLVHDDLPCMDDDDLRRGRPTSHKVFGEGAAVLAGDALLTEAFVLLASNRTGLPETSALKIVHLIADAAGSRHLIGGQMADLENEGKRVSKQTLQFIHRQKTSALIEASVLSGAAAGGATPAQIRHLSAYARAIGLAFQIADDILDVTGDEQKMGKRVRKDSGKHKATYPGLYGLEKSRALLRRLTQQALRALRSFDAKADALRAMGEFLATREN